MGLCMRVGEGERAGGKFSFLSFEKKKDENNIC